MKTSNRPYYIILTVAATFLVSAISFWGGMQWQKQHSAVVAASSLNVQGGAKGSFGGGGPARGGMRGGTFGTVQSINGTTMTVSSQRTGTTVTVSLTNNPTITSVSGAAATISDITAGSTVIVRGSADASGTIQATAIRINPNIGGAPPAASNNTGGQSGGI